MNKSIAAHEEFDPDGVEYVWARPPRPVVIADADPRWASDFERLRSRLLSVLGNKALSIEHVGSTSVPGLAAKPIIDVDLVVADSSDEAAYAPALQAAGFPLVLRERSWHQHRLFGSENPYGNIHVFSPDSPELVRHVLFRDRLRTHPEERELYLTAKRRAASVGENTTDVERSGSAVGDVAGQAYNERKQSVIREILDRALSDRLAQP